MGNNYSKAYEGFQSLSLHLPSFAGGIVGLIVIGAIVGAVVWCFGSRHRCKLQLSIHISSIFCPISCLVIQDAPCFPDYMHQQQQQQQVDDILKASNQIFYRCTHTQCLPSLLWAGQVREGGASGKKGPFTSPLILELSATPSHPPEKIRKIWSKLKAQQVKFRG